MKKIILVLIALFSANLTWAANQFLIIPNGAILIQGGISSTTLNVPEKDIIVDAYQPQKVNLGQVLDLKFPSGATLTDYYVLGWGINAIKEADLIVGYHSPSTVISLIKAAGNTPPLQEHVIDVQWQRLSTSTSGDGSSGNGGGSGSSNSGNSSSGSSNSSNYNPWGSGYYGGSYSDSSYIQQAISDYLSNPNRYLHDIGSNSTSTNNNNTNNNSGYEEEYVFLDLCDSNGTSVYSGMVSKSSEFGNNSGTFLLDNGDYAFLCDDGSNTGGGTVLTPQGGNQNSTTTDPNSSNNTAPSNNNNTGTGLVKCGGTGQVACHATSTGGGISNIYLQINELVKWLIGLAVSIFSIIAMYAGYLLLTSGDNASKRGEAKKILMNAILGFVIMLSAWLIVSYILDNLLVDKNQYMLLQQVSGQK